ncbi:hypothetical protein H4W26_001161 [Nesterenkonia halotolerans]|uniref:Uncharacterized protein n=1 Tax=Nesterenkonia halotolerans TaxID=225325 RepID=A0ABR9J752_9MICC|nr:hypothetical protein [Nesterenkonia halotolerans]
MVCVGAGIGILAAHRRASDATQLHPRFADTDPIYFRIYAIFFGIAMIAAGLTIIFVLEH